MYRGPPPSNANEWPLTAILEFLIACDAGAPDDNPWRSPNSVMEAIKAEYNNKEAPVSAVVHGKRVLRNFPIEIARVLTKEEDPRWMKHLRDAFKRQSGTDLIDVKSDARAFFLSQFGISSDLGLAGLAVRTF